MAILERRMIWTPMCRWFGYALYELAELPRAFGQRMISGICHVLNYLSGSKVGNFPILIAFSPFLLILIPLLTVDKGYWERIRNKRRLASLLLLDFANNPTTAVTTVLSFLLFGAIGYMARYCIFVWPG